MSSRITKAQRPFLLSPSPSATGIQGTGPNTLVLLSEGHEVCYSHSRVWVQGSHINISL